MPGFERHHVDAVVRRLADDPKRLVIAVTGPRRTGKTTVIRQALERAGLPYRYVDFDRPADPLGPPSAFPEPSRKSARDVSLMRTRDAGWLVRLWERARREAEASERGFVLALDEIQHVEGWSAAAKALWDEDEISRCPLRVIVSGSAPWSMLTGLSESMVGRFFPVPVRHWSLAEMATAFDVAIDEYLFFGGYPGAAHLTSNQDEWRRYVRDVIVRPTIARDIIGLTRVDKPPLMRRLMDLASTYSGQILSYNKMLGQLQDAGNTTTLARYLDLLSDAGLVAGLGAYSAKPHLGKASSPKLNVLNTAVMTAPSGYTFEEARADRSFWGRIVESAVGAHLHNSLATATNLHYWRDRAHEVDFVLSRGPNVLGIEVKSGPRRASPAGLSAFKDRFPRARTLLVGEGGVPLNEFLSAPADHWLDEHPSEVQ